MDSQPGGPQRNQALADSADGQCWICFSDDVGDLISPCVCKGSVGLVHEACLLKYLSHVCMGCGSAGVPRCPNCNTKYQFLLDAEEAGPNDEVNVDEEAMGVRGFVRVCKVFKIIQTMTPGKERASIVSKYTMHVLVQTIAVVCLASIGYTVFMHVTPSSHSEPAACPQTLRRLQRLLDKTAWPNSFDQSPMNEPLWLKLKESDCTGGWPLVYIWLQYVTCARAVFFAFAMSNLVGTLRPWVPCLPGPLAENTLAVFEHAQRLRQFIVCDHEEESPARALSFFVWLTLPLVFMSMRNSLATLGQMLLAHEMLPTTASYVIEYGVCKLCSLYSIVFTTVLCDIIFLASCTSEMFATAAEDLDRFRVSCLRKQLQVGCVRVHDRGSQK